MTLNDHPHTLMEVLRSTGTFQWKLFRILPNLFTLRYPSPQMKQRPSGEAVNHHCRFRDMTKTPRPRLEQLWFHHWDGRGGEHLRLDTPGQLVVNAAGALSGQSHFEVHRDRANSLRPKSRTQRLTSGFAGMDAALRNSADSLVE